MPTWSAVFCVEVPGSRNEWCDEGGRAHASVVLEVAPELRETLVADLYTSAFSNPVAYDLSAGSQYAPRRWPGYLTDGPVSPTGIPATDLNRIGVVSHRFETKDNEKYIGENEATNPALSTIMEAKMFQVRVQYGQYWNINETITHSIETITQDHRDFKWKTQVTPQDTRQLKDVEVPVKILREAVITREFKGISGNPEYSPGQSVLPDFRTLFDLVGKKSTIDYTSAQLGGRLFPAGTLALQKVHITRGEDRQSIIDVNGDGTSWINNYGASGYNCKLSFLYKPQGHDKFWRPRIDENGTRGGFDEIVIRLENDPNGGEYVPVKPDARIDSNWLQPAMLPIPIDTPIIGVPS